jgi:hypothetical protein
MERPGVKYELHWHGFDFVVLGSVDQHGVALSLKIGETCCPVEQLPWSAISLVCRLRLTRLSLD